jgi:hypothetical protein
MFINVHHFSKNHVEIWTISIVCLESVLDQDYTARVHLDLQDPGKAYPALSTCVARELTGQSEAPGPKCGSIEFYRSIPSIPDFCQENEENNLDLGSDVQT